LKYLKHADLVNDWSFDSEVLNIERVGIEINLPCVENTHRACIYNKEYMG